MDILMFELVLLWCTAGLYLLAGILFGYAIALRKEAGGRRAMIIASAGLLLHSAALLIR